MRSKDSSLIAARMAFAVFTASKSDEFRPLEVNRSVGALRQRFPQYLLGPGWAGGDATTSPPCFSF